MSLPPDLQIERRTYLDAGDVAGWESRLTEEVFQIMGSVWPPTLIARDLESELADATDPVPRLETLVTRYRSLALSD